MQLVVGRGRGAIAPLSPPWIGHWMLHAIRLSALSDYVHPTTIGRVCDCMISCNNKQKNSRKVKFTYNMILHINEQRSIRRPTGWLNCLNRTHSVSIYCKMRNHSLRERFLPGISIKPAPPLTRPCSARSHALSCNPHR